MVVLVDGTAMFTDPVLVTRTSEIAEICRFRAAVLAATGTLRSDAFGAEGWHDPIDEHSRHWIIRHQSGTLAAAGRLSIHAELSAVHQAEEYLRYGIPSEGPIAAPDRVVVAPEFQGQGLGGQLVDIQDREAQSLGARLAVRQASPSMVRLIVERGWIIAGPATLDSRFPGIEFSVAYRLFTDRATSQD